MKKMTTASREYTVAEFCKHHYACHGQAKVAIDTYASVWQAWDELPANDLIWVATRLGVLDNHTLRLFACWCVRQVWHFLTGDCSRKAIEVGEQFARGEATADELNAALDAARGAARAAKAAAAAAGINIQAAWAAGLTIDAVENEAKAAARDAQAKWLRENAQPNFSSNKTGA